MRIILETSVNFPRKTLYESETCHSPCVNDYSFVCARGRVCAVMCDFGLLERRLCWNEQEMCVFKETIEQRNSE